MPDVDGITERVLSGEGVSRSTDNNYYLGEDRSLPGLEAHVPAVLHFLGRLKSEIDQYYQDEPDRSTNYENLYYVASQIQDSELREYDNPAVQSLIDKICPDIEPLLAAQQWRLLDLAGESANYILDVVRHLLTREPPRIGHLASLRDACIDDRPSSVDVFTVNHDTVLEQCFSQNDVPFTDGFDGPINQLRYWNPGLFESQPPRVRLFKLHGSVNWYEFSCGGCPGVRVGISLQPDVWRTSCPTGHMQFPIRGRPMLLAGTFNKMLQYTSGIYAGLHYQFYRSLRETPQLVVCGYGFGDKGINTRIVEWAHSSPDQRMVVVDPTPDALKRRARGAISGNWDDWVAQKKMAVIPKAIQDTSWQEMRTSLIDTEG